MQKSEIALWHEYSQTGNVNIQNCLFGQYKEWAQWLAHCLFSKSYIQSVELEEFEQFAFEGLLRAIANYSVKRGVKFKTFAEYRIKGNILNNLPRLTETSAYYYKKDKTETRPQEKITSVLATEDITRLEDIVNELSIQYFLTNEEESMVLYQGDSYSSPEFSIMSTRVLEMAQLLKEPMKSIINAYYQKGVSFSTIADLLNLTKGRVSQLHVEGLRSIKKSLGW